MNKEKNKVYGIQHCLSFSEGFLINGHMSALKLLSATLDKTFKILEMGFYA